MSEAESIRVFCAVELPEEICAAAASRAARLRRDYPAPRVRWPRPEGMHVTLKFLGKLEVEQLEVFTRAVSSAVKGFAPFKLSIEGAGAFPSWWAASVLWLGVRDESLRLARLHGRLEDECEAAGFPREGRTFHPHLTFARIRTPKEAKSLCTAHERLPFGPLSFDVTEVVIMRSELGPGGSRYTPLSRHAF